MGDNVGEATVDRHNGSRADQQHLAWLARSFGGRSYAPLSDTDLEVLLASAEMLSKFPGAHLFREGERADAAFVVENGHVEIYRGAGASRRVVSHIGSGSVIGDIDMFAAGSYMSSALALDRVRIFRFDRARLLPELARHPGIFMRWMVAGWHQMESTQRRVIELMHKTVLGQVADLLTEEADEEGDVYLSQTTISTLLGVSRQSVNEALGRLREQGAVETGYRQIRVLDPERVAAIGS